MDGIACSKESSCVTGQNTCDATGEEKSSAREGVEVFAWSLFAV